MYIICFKKGGPLELIYFLNRYLAEDSEIQDKVPVMQACNDFSYIVEVVTFRSENISNKSSRGLLSSHGTRIGSSSDIII